MRIWGISKVREAFSNIKTELEQQQQRQAQLDNKQEQINTRQTQLEKTAEQLESELQKTRQELESCQNQLKQMIEDCRQEAQQKSEQLAVKNKELEDWKDTFSGNNWRMMYSYDSMVAQLQLDAIEQRMPGNRQRLSSLKDTHVGESCFVIGNGPSLVAEDLTKLAQANVFSFGSKRINVIFPKTAWRPDIWAASDLDYIEMYKDEIQDLKGFTKMLPCQAVLDRDVLVRDAVYFPFIQSERTPCWFNNDITKGVHFWGTVTCKLINIAVYMGFKNIYLLGVDHSWPILHNKDGVGRWDTSKKAHFSDEYMTKEQESVISQHIGNMEKTVQYISQAYHDVGWFCRQSGVNIYNATPGTCLTEFPCITLDEALGMIKQQKD